MSRLLVTGGAGFIGSNLVDRLIEDGNRVVVIDNFATARHDSLPADSELLSVHDAHIADDEALRAAFDDASPDVVIHAAAAYKDPDDWDEDIRTNALRTTRVVRPSTERRH